MRIMEFLLARICCRNIDNCKMHLLGSVGDIEIGYWQHELDKWQEKMNDIVIHE